MNSRLHIYFSKVLNWKLFALFNIFNKFKIPQIAYIKLTFSIRDSNNIDDLNFIKSCHFLEAITGQKPKIIPSSSEGHAKRKKLNFISQVTLRNNKMYEFLDFFLLFIMENLKRKVLKINKVIDNQGNLCIVIKDLSVFPALNNENLNWNYPLKIDFVFKNSDMKKTEILLNELGFYNN